MKTFFLFFLISFELFATQTLYPFQSDGCSRFPDGTASEPTKWLHCCIAHDLLYWQGGDQTDRKNADINLKKCIAGLGHKVTADLVYKGVRFGGGAFISKSFRNVFNCRLGWGNGWEIARGYRKLSREEIRQLESMTPSGPIEVVKQFCQSSDLLISND
jgi:hypothetical protein